MSCTDREYYLAQEPRVYVWITHNAVRDIIAHSQQMRDASQRLAVLYRKILDLHENPTIAQLRHKLQIQGPDV